jgi:hypothetical protein
LDVLKGAPVAFARAQMQAATDTAALEGLRFRDAGKNVSYELLDETRRLRASRLARLTFDEDLLVGAADVQPDERQFGAGPIFDLSGGITEILASQQLGGNHAVHRPSLEINLANEHFGDMVAGMYLGEPSARSLEDSQYLRNDFLPSQYPPESSIGNPRGSAFLVRMRRTNDLFGLDNLPGVSSSGPALPFLFGRGTVMGGGTASSPGSAPSAYSPRVDGLTVRATSIAAASPALSVGAPLRGDSPNPDDQVLGVTPFVIWNIVWKKLDRILAEQIPIRINERGKIKIFPPEDLIAGEEFIDPDRAGGPAGLGDDTKSMFGTPDPRELKDRRVLAYFPPAPYPSSVGQRVVRESVPVSSEGPKTFLGYAPIVRKFSRENGFPTDEKNYVRVIAFALVQIRVNKIPGAVTIRKFPGVVAPENVSAAMPEGFAGLRKRQVETIMEAHQKVQDPILAPVLVE